MGAIKVLDEFTAAQIAAGEVVERPASVIKELVENAIDAGSSRIEINVVTGPDWRMVVRDNGCGIASDEVETAFARHATSKIGTAEDLWRITTLGFRGEALASIAAVAEVEMVTRPAPDPTGSRIVLKGGGLIKAEPCACAKGTRVTVSGLFFNTPARRKQLENSRRELRLIGEVAGWLALAHPQVAFSLTVNGRLSWQTAGKGEALDAVAAVWGDELARRMLNVAGEEGRTRVQGCVGRPGIGRRGRQHQLLVVNGRPVVSREFGYMLDHLYHDMLVRPNRPVALILLTLPSDALDVNVHPSKTKIRFLEPQGVWVLVRRCIGHSLQAAASPVPIAISPPAKYPEGAGLSRITMGDSFQARLKRNDSRQLTELAEPARNLTSLREFSSLNPLTKAPENMAEKVREQSAFPWSAPASTDDRLPYLNVIGQLAGTYILAEGEGNLYLIDQHAAHERIRYTELSNRPQGASATQMLTVPVSVTLSSPDLDLFWQQAAVFHHLGFLVERFGSGGLLIRGVPAALPPAEAVSTFQELAASLRTGPARASAAMAEEGRKLVACRGAIKARQFLEIREMSALLEDLRRVSQPFTCPHGRPAILVLSQQELARAFGRS